MQGLPDQKRGKKEQDKEQDDIRQIYVDLAIAGNIERQQYTQERVREIDAAKKKHDAQERAIQHMQE